MWDIAKGMCANESQDEGRPDRKRGESKVNGVGFAWTTKYDKVQGMLPHFSLEAIYPGSLRSHTCRDTGLFHLLECIQGHSWECLSLCIRTGREIGS
jgi:hypothetical protein